MKPSPTAAMPPVLLSDDELLGLIFLLRERACTAEIQDEIARRAGGRPSERALHERVERLRQAQLVRFVYLPGRSDCLRLTALGAERLQSLQGEPLHPPMGFPDDRE